MEDMTFFTNAVRPVVCPREHDPFKYAAWFRQFSQGVTRDFAGSGDHAFDANVVGLYCQHDVEYTLKVDDMSTNVYPLAPIMTHAILEARDRTEYVGKGRSSVRMITWTIIESGLTQTNFSFDGHLNDWLKGGKIVQRQDASGTIDQIRNYAAGCLVPGNRLIERWTPQTLTAFEDEQAADAAQQTWKDYVHNYVARGKKDDVGQYKMTAERLAERLKMNLDRLRAALSRMGRKID